MANEAVEKTILQTEGIDFLCADSVGIEKGTLLKLSGEKTVAAANAIGNVFMGVCSREKIAGDGRSHASVKNKGIYDMVAGCAITEGMLVKLSGNNTITTADLATDVISGMVIGKALETATNGEAIEVLLL